MSAFDIDFHSASNLSDKFKISVWPNVRLLNVLFLFFIVLFLFFIVLFFLLIVLFLLWIVLFYVLFVCKCVLYYCHRVATQLQLTHISYHILSNSEPLSVQGHTNFSKKSRGHIIILGDRKVTQQVSSTNIRGHLKKKSVNKEGWRHWFMHYRVNVTARLGVKICLRFGRLYLITEWWKSYTEWPTGTWHLLNG